MRVAHRAALHPLQFREQRAEQFELARIANRAVGLDRDDLGQHAVERVRLRSELPQAPVPGLQLRGVVGQTVDGLLELYRAPQGELVEMLRRLRLLEVEQAGLVLTAVVQQVAEVDPGLRVALSQVQRAPQPVERGVLIAQPVRRVSQTRRGLR